MTHYTAPAPAFAQPTSLSLSTATTSQRPLLKSPRYAPATTTTTKNPRCHRHQHHNVNIITMTSPPNSTVLSNVLIIGANRGLGAALTSYLHKQNVKSLTTTHRPQTTCPDQQRDNSTTVLMLDALDRSAAFETLSKVNPSIVISCVGAGADFSDTDDAEHEMSTNANGISPSSSNSNDLSVAKNLMDAAAEVSSVQRFIFISALGAGHSEHAVPSQVMIAMRHMLLDKTDAEAYLKNHPSKMPWTIVRPAPLVEGIASGESVITEDVNCYGTLCRPDLAQAITKIAQNDACIGRILHVVDRKKVLVTSPYVRPLEFWEGLPFEEFEF